MFQIIHIIVLLPKGIIKVMVWMSIYIPNCTFDVIFINGLYFLYFLISIEMKAWVNNHIALFFIHSTIARKPSIRDLGKWTLKNIFERVVDT